MTDSSPFFNTSQFSETPIDQKLNYLLFKSSFLKFKITRDIPNYILRFLPADIQEIYLYFSSRYKNNMFFIIVRTSNFNGKNDFRLLALSSIFQKKSEVNYVIEYSPSFKRANSLEISCDKFLQNIFSPIGQPMAGKTVKLIFHRALSFCNLSIKLNSFFLENGFSSIMVPSLYEWLQFKYDNFGNGYVNCRNLDFTIKGYSKDYKINILCGLENLGTDISRIQNLNGIEKDIHYFIKGDTYWFGKRIPIYNPKTAEIPNIDSPKILSFTYDFEYYERDNGRNGQIIFEIPINKINFISSQINLLKEQNDQNIFDM